MAGSVEPRLRVTRQQILAFRRRVGALDERMPMGSKSLRRAAWAGLQDSMPRAALLSLHARVDGVEPSTWEHPSLAQLWGPRYSTYVVPKRDFALFSLGRLPDDAKSRLRAERIAERLHAHLDGRRMTDREAAGALGIGYAIRYAATTGTVAIRWEGARAPTVWTVDALEFDPADACRELARRYLHIFGPATADGFARWAGISRRVGGQRVRLARRIASGGPIAARPRVAARRRRAGHSRRRDGSRARAPAAERRFLLPARRSRAGASHPAAGSAAAALDAPRVARRAPRRRRDPRNLATGAAHRANRRLDTALAWAARRDRGRGRRPAASRRRATYRGGLEHLSRASGPRLPARRLHRHVDPIPGMDSQERKMVGHRLWRSAVSRSYSSPSG